MQRIEHLSQIELSLFEREVNLDKDLQKLNKKERELSLQAQNLSSFKMMSNQLTLQSSLGCQTDFAFYEQVVAREALVTNLEKAADLKLFRYTELLRQLEAQRRSLMTDMEMHQNHLDAQTNELDRREQQIRDRFEDALRQPFSSLGESDEKLAEYISTMDKHSQASVPEEQEAEFANFLRLPRSQLFVDKMTELVHSYSETGFASEEQYELLLFKRAKTVLQIEFEACKHKALA